MNKDWICANCKHWDRETEVEYNCGSTGLRYCTKIIHVDNIDNVAACTMDCDLYLSHFLTRSYFGCNQFEPTEAAIKIGVK